MKTEKVKDVTLSDIFYSAGWIIGMNGMMASLINCYDLQEEAQEFLILGAILGAVSIVAGVAERIVCSRKIESEDCAYNVLSGLTLSLSALGILALANTDLMNCLSVLAIACSCVYINRPAQEEEAPALRL